MREPVQPFFVFNSMRYYKRMYVDGDIAHIYEFTCERSHARSLAIPDGSIDVMFDLSDPSLNAFAAGTVLSWHNVQVIKGHTYFGARFRPGIVPPFLDVSFRELVGKELDLLVCPSNKELAERLSELPDFRSRANFFEMFYEKCRENITSETSGAKNPSSGKENILHTVRNMITDSGGTARIQDIASETGYSSRYIYRLFHDAYGISPKTYAGIVRFQGAIDAIDHDSSTALSSLAVDHGYFDQPQFIRDFRKYADTTPMAYRKQVISSDYLDKFIIS